MRKYYSNILRKLFYKHLISSRTKLKYTQSDMARVLVMDDRSYIELDHGKSCCSALTLMLFLCYCCDNPLDFIADFKAEVEKEADNVI